MVHGVLATISRFDDLQYPVTSFFRGGGRGLENANRHQTLSGGDFMKRVLALALGMGIALFILGLGQFAWAQESGKQVLIVSGAGM